MYPLCGCMTRYIYDPQLFPQNFIDEVDAATLLHTGLVWFNNIKISLLTIMSSYMLFKVKVFNSYCLFNRSMACPYWWLCGVCTATHRDQKHGSLRAPLWRNIHVRFLQKQENAVNGESGPHWAENYVAFSTLRTEIFYTAETLYMCVCVCTYIKKKRHITLLVNLWWFGTFI